MDRPGKWSITINQEFSKTVSKRGNGLLRENFDQGSDMIRPEDIVIVQMSNQGAAGEGNPRISDAGYASRHVVLASLIRWEINYS
jgi:hypothetical protein